MLSSAECVDTEIAGVLPSHHVSLFDRLLVAQAQVEELTLPTAEGPFAASGVAIA